MPPQTQYHFDQRAAHCVERTPNRVIGASSRKATHSDTGLSNRIAFGREVQPGGGC
jgi:hypothetical protein